MVSKKTETHASIHADSRGYVTPQTALCGATVASYDPNRVQPSTSDLARVTCPICQGVLRNASRLFVAARRAKRIAWAAEPKQVRYA